MALVAGGSGFPVALRLGLAMAILQVSIGAVNDLHDAADDAGRKPGKPIPAGLATPAAARWLASVSLLAGLALAAPSGAATVAIACLGLGCGYAYDLRFSRTVWSWLPLSAALPLVPAFAWLGAVGRLPPAFPILVPIAVLAGAALAVGNGLADLERDVAAGRPTITVHLGRLRAAAATTLLHVGVAGLAMAALAFGGWWGVVAWGVPLGALLTIGGSVAGGRGGPGARERAWELEAIGTGILGASWLAAVARLGMPR